MTERALKTLRCVRDETLVLQEQLLEEIESEHGVSLEFVLRIESRLETLSIAVRKTNRQEPDIVSLKKEVLENLETLHKSLLSNKIATEYKELHAPISKLGKLVDKVCTQLYFNLQ